jgi:uncharacterized protein (DUF1810 family)
MESLDRFKRAQEQSVGGFDTAIRELQSGFKRSHWIWYIFPQLRGLGLSEISRTYGIDGVAEAIDYLRDPLLRSRLVAISTLVADRLRADQSLPLATLLGSEIDVAKIISSLTLFEAVATRVCGDERLEGCAALADASREILATARTQGYPPCEWTRAQLLAAGLVPASPDAKNHAEAKERERTS